MVYSNHKENFGFHYEAKKREMVIVCCFYLSYRLTFILKDDWNAHYFFSFVMSLTLDQLAFAQLSVIHFQLRFDSFGVIAYTNALLIVPIDEILMGSKPVYKTKFSSLKSKAITTLVDHSPSIKASTIIPIKILKISF